MLFLIREYVATGMTALQIAATHGFSGAAEILIDQACILGRAQAIDAVDDLGMTSLMMAAKNGHLDVVEALDEAGAVWSLRSKEGMRARDYAAKSGVQAVFLFFCKPRRPQHSRKQIEQNKRKGSCTYNLIAQTHLA